jgi:hypothetical protein
VTSGNAALLTTVWLAMAGFVAGQAGQRVTALTGRAPGWAWPVWSAGALLCVTHALLALAVRYEWNHERAVSATADQTAAVYGLHWGGGIYVNYVFLAVWLADAAWWRFDAAAFLSRPCSLTILVRAFYFIVLINAAVVFASHRFPGLILMALLLWIWRPLPARSSAL